jgi:YHS domain-containing protein
MDENIKVKDLVCGMEKLVKEMQASSVFNGKTYYFCSQTDKDMFEANPEHWVPREDVNK